MQRKITTAISQHSLITPGDKVIVALSGGADSVCLFRVLHAMGVNIMAAHCNFHLRGDESNRDEAFVRKLCNNLGVQLFVTDFDTRAYVEQHHVSIEMAARELRYEWFHRLIDEQKAQSIAVAHHEDDVAETVLLNLVRGTGIQGVSGIAWRNGHIIRPLLGVSREEILSYLKDIGQDYVTDSTNLEDDCKRNILRLCVMPELQRLNPSAAHSIALSASHLANVARIYDEAMLGATARVMNDCTINLPLLMEETAPESVLYECLKPYGFTSAAVADFFPVLSEGESGRMLETNEWRVLLNRDELIVARRNDATTVPLRIEEHVTISTSAFTPDFAISRSPQTATLDADLIALPLTIRHAVPGDRFHPFGMKGTKLLSDFMTDLKLSLYQKEQQLVVTDASGAIVWVVGLRSDNRFRVSSTTSRVIVLKIAKESQ